MLLRYETAAFVAGLLDPVGVRAISKVSSSIVHKTHYTSNRCGQLEDSRTTIRRVLTTTSAATLSSRVRQVQGCPSPSGSRCRQTLSSKAGQLLQARVRHLRVVEVQRVLRKQT